MGPLHGCCHKVDSCACYDLIIQFLIVLLSILHYSTFAEEQIILSFFGRGIWCVLFICYSPVIWVIYLPKIVLYIFYSLMYGAEDPSIAGMVLDSPFSDLVDLMMELVDTYKVRLPKFTVSNCFLIIILYIVEWYSYICTWSFLWILFHFLRVIFCFPASLSGSIVLLTLSA